MKNVNQIFQGLHFQEVLDVSIFSHSCSSKVYDFFFLEFFFSVLLYFGPWTLWAVYTLHKIPLPEGILTKNNNDSIKQEWKKTSKRKEWTKQNHGWLKDWQRMEKNWRELEVTNLELMYVNIGTFVYLHQNSFLCNDSGCSDSFSLFFHKQHWKIRN